MKLASALLRLMRFDRPIGIFLTLWPTLWAVWIAGNHHPSLKIVLIFTTGAVMMRAAGCVINDIADRHYDCHVARTKTRPLTAGDVKLWQAITLFIALLFIALILVLQLNYFSLWIALFTLPLTILYPFCKRFTHLPQIILGVVFNIGILMAFAAQQNQLPINAWLLYSVAIIWTVAYDTMYAITDQDDDKKLGLKSTALLFGKWSQFIVGILQFIFMLGMITLGVRLQAPLSYWAGLVVSGMLCVYQQYLVAKGQPFKAFLNNNWLGLVIFIGVFLWL